ncbi:galactose oxidase-like domain-containing protein [Parasediminibacterium sp. JCM 36343]|uniref:galactose oxidase-like domain-containing protein n=1 Tax=Parasediminibacterium sp. JCM 36343 TaxID=3374279 RepID=UPI00397AC439
MGVLLQGFYKKKPNNAVPSPADGNTSVPWWWDNLATEANSLRKAGFSAVWLPPVLKTSSGINPSADGYGPYDDYDIGSKEQKNLNNLHSIKDFVKETRFGSREQLQRCVATLRANGLDVYLDMVEHHRSGDEIPSEMPPFVFRYPGADGTLGIGRFEKNPLNFLPQVDRDSHLGGSPADDKPFGRELAPINAKPLHYVFDNLIAASDWLTRALDVQGYRLDDVKGLSTDFLRPFLESKSMAGKFAVGEYFDGNRVLVNGWVFNPKGMGGRSSAFDFPLKFILTSMCNNPGRFNMSDLDHAGLTGISPMNSVTFVENHDTDLSNSDSIVFNKILGYAYILTSEGYPCVYYRDYDMGPDGYKLKPQIDNLIWIHEKLASGSTQQRWKDFDVFAYERMGGAHLLVGLNNDPGISRTITVATGFGANKVLHDYSGHAPNAITDGNGNVTITIPQNINGLGYVCYSVDGQGGGFEITTKSVTQDFEGAADLDIPPAQNGKQVQVGRVWCASNSPIRVQLKPVTTGWKDTTSILLELVAPNGEITAQQFLTIQTPKDTALSAVTMAEGFYQLRLTLSNTSGEILDAPYTLSVTYTAPFILNTETTEIAISTSDSAIVGKWSDKIDLPNVPIHTHVLPTGKVLFWGRRNPPGTTDFDSLNQHETHAFLWDPADPKAPTKATSNNPKDHNGKDINLFCSSHTFLADGRLLVTGGHFFDSQGIECSTFYDPFKDTWATGPVMNNGRWYPTVITLPDGGAFVCGGTFSTGPLKPPPNSNTGNLISQILENNIWNDLAQFIGIPLFPRFHVVPNGDLFMSGPRKGTFRFENFSSGKPGNWVQLGERITGNCEYAPSVMYDEGKIIFIGGGGGGGTDNGTPEIQNVSNVAEKIDFSTENPSWSLAANMKFHRRQHNATILADGTVLVTGGSQGEGFNDLDPGMPVHIPELWDATSDTWTQMAPEAVDRCYHSTAVLLPDGRVFSGGGGEYAPVDGEANSPKDTHADAQLFSPPYLFKGTRPVIKTAPLNVKYSTSFEIELDKLEEVSLITWIRLSSVTHSFNTNQRINFLKFQQDNVKITITAPKNSNVCPPGHYMLFVLNKQKVPSIAKIIQITPTVSQAITNVLLETGSSNFKPLSVKVMSPFEQDAAIASKETRPPIVIGVTATCPYGISSCWAGAYETLGRLSGVRLVRPIPNAQDSTAFVYLENEGLPDLDKWPSQFAEVANGTHLYRGVEVTIRGTVNIHEGGNLKMQASATRQELLIYPMVKEDKIQWDHTNRSPQPLDPIEQDAWHNLENDVRAYGGSFNVTITGPLKKNENGYILEVRDFKPDK